MDRTTQDEIKAHLMQTSDQFRELMHRHHELDRQVDEMESKHVLSTEEQIEENRLKKLKLHLKDEMEQMISQYSLQHTAG